MFGRGLYARGVKWRQVLHIIDENPERLKWLGGVSRPCGMLARRRWRRLFIDTYIPIPLHNHANSLSHHRISLALLTIPHNGKGPPQEECFKGLPKPTGALLTRALSAVSVSPTRYHEVLEAGSVNGPVRSEGFWKCAMRRQITAEEREHKSPEKDAKRLQITCPRCRTEDRP